MMSETGNPDLIEDEDTEDTTDDTCEPPIDLTARTAHAMRGDRVKIQNLTNLPQEEEVIRMICANARIDSRHLKISRKVESSEGLSYLECSCPCTNLSYVYMTITTNRKPYFGGVKNNSRVTINQPDASFLLKIEVNGESTVVGHWKN